MLLKLLSLLLCSAYLALSAPAAGRDLPDRQLFTCIRAGDTACARAALIAGASVNARDADGATPLLYAALYSPDTATMRLLLESGAHVDAINNAGASALLWATNSLEKVKLLVGSGADVNARSHLGKTALMIAASRDGAGPVVAYLLAHGARTDFENTLLGAPPIPMGGGGATALVEASKARDGEALGLLLRSGAAVNVREKNGSTALLNAIAQQNHRNIDMLLKHGADWRAAMPTGLSPLVLAAMRDDVETARRLLANGGKADEPDGFGNTPLLWAAYSDRAHPALVNLLLAAGADVRHKNKAGETALDWAARRGRTPVVERLSAATGTQIPLPLPATLPTAAPALPTGIDRSLVLLQKAGPAVFQQRGCVSCHNNMLPAVAVKMAHDGGHAVDAKAMEREGLSLLSILKPVREMLLENGDNLPDLAMTGPYALLALSAQEYAPDSLTDALVHNLANKQNSDGSWTIWAPRPPIESGDMQATALCLRALQLYGFPSRRSEFEARIQKAGRWLLSAKPENATDENWRALGLFWSHTDTKAIQHATRQILSHQHADGGWSQLPSLASDAYATGQTLYTLATVSPAHLDSRQWSRAIHYLRQTQLPDGSWHVVSRAFPFQPYFESGFPHGHDQWISMAGTSWATIALTLEENRTLGAATLTASSVRSRAMSPHLH